MVPVCLCLCAWFMALRNVVYTGQEKFTNLSLVNRHPAQEFCQLLKKHYKFIIKLKLKMKQEE